ncbi:MAG: hypothetical protein ACFFCS_14880 [Candidatus Hodarchaeota archaeon]
MGLFEELKNDLHARKLSEKDFERMMRAFEEFAKTNEEARQLVKDITEDGDRVIINFDFGPDGKFCWAAENGELSIRYGIQREDADGTGRAPGKEWFNAMINRTTDLTELSEHITIEGHAERYLEFNPLNELIVKELEMPPGMRDSRVVELEPMEMVAYHHAMEQSIPATVAGLIERLNKHRIHPDEIYLIHDKPLLHMFGPGKQKQDKTCGIIAMVPIPKDKEGIFSSKEGAGLYKISFEGGKHGAVDSLVSDLHPSLLLWRRFFWISFCKRHDVVFDKNKGVMLKILIDKVIRDDIIANPRKTIEEKAEDIKAIIYAPLIE